MDRGTRAERLRWGDTLYCVVIIMELKMFELAAIGRNKLQKHSQLLVSIILLIVGVILVITTFTSPTSGTAVLCSYHTTHWEVFGIHLPIVRSIEIQPMQMSIVWSDSCNIKKNSLLVPIGGILSLAVSITLIGDI